MKAINKTKTTKKHSKLHRWMVPAVLAALVAVGSPAVSQAEAPTQNACLLYTSPSPRDS